jgi:hypothetical protein
VNTNHPPSACGRSTDDAEGIADGEQAIREELAMSRKISVSVALVAITTVSVLASYPAWARGGSHGSGLGAARGAASSPIGATGGVVAHPSTNQVVNINTVQPQTVSPNVSTPLGSGAGGGGSPSANVRNLTNAVSPNGLGNSGMVVVQPPRGTNALGTAQSSGLPPNAEGPRKKTDDVIDQENTTVDRAVKGICRGC